MPQIVKAAVFDAEPHVTHQQIYRDTRSAGDPSLDAAGNGGIGLRILFALRLAIH